MTKPIYTVSVKSRFGWDKHRVTNHYREDFQSGAWMVLELVDESTLTVPISDRFALKVHPDFAHEKKIFADFQDAARAEAEKIVRARDAEVNAKLEAHRRSEHKYPAPGNVPVNPYANFVPPLTGLAPQ